MKVTFMMTVGGLPGGRAGEAASSGCTSRGHPLPVPRGPWAPRRPRPGPLCCALRVLEAPGEAGLRGRGRPSCPGDPRRPRRERAGSGLCLLHSRCRGTRTGLCLGGTRARARLLGNGGTIEGPLQVATLSRRCSLTTLLSKLLVSGGSGNGIFRRASGFL